MRTRLPDISLAYHEPAWTGAASRATRQETGTAPERRALHPQNPPTKHPLVALMKQARAFGVGMVVATQNPMDLDYRALGNAGLWCVGRLQTDADRARVVEGLSSAGAQGGYSAAELTGVLKQLAPRWFLTRDAHAAEGT